MAADSRTVILPNEQYDEIHFYDILTGTVDTLLCDPSPRAVAITPDGSTAVVGHFNTPIVSVIDVPTLT